MTASNPKEDIRNLITAGELDQAIQQFRELLPSSSPLINDLASYQAQNAKLDKDYKAGLVDFGELEKSKRRIILGMLEMLNRWQSDAAALIQMAVRSQATFLDLGNCSLSAIPSSIVELQWLEELNLGSVYWDDARGQFAGTRNDGAANDLSSETFEVLQKLQNLRKLSLRTCNLKDLQGIGALRQLHTLSVGQNDLEDISPLSNLTNLEVLSLFGNRVVDISPLAALRKLQVLSINDNMVSDLSPLRELHHLRDLHLAGNRIQSLAPLAGLTQLEVLNVDSNQVEAVEPIIGLANLKTFNLNANPVRDCPPEIAFSKDISLIRAFFQAKRRSGEEMPPEEEAPGAPAAPAEILPVLEVKLILVGNSSAGKTSVSKLLRGISFDTRESTTHGISVSEWMVPAKEIGEWRSKDMPEYQVKVNIWDFGGQEYYHGTHRIFLDSNAVYVLVWDYGTNINHLVPTDLYADGEKMTVPLEHFHFQYWLDNIRFHAPGTITGEKPPIILLENKIDKKDGQEHWYDRQILERYDVALTASVSAQYARSREPRRRRYRYAFDIFREDLLRILVKKAEANSSIANLPAEWEQVRDWIRALQHENAPDNPSNPFQQRIQEKGWIMKEDFAAACREVRAELSAHEIDQLSSFLHQTGVVVWLPHIDDKRVYLDPSWLTERMYRVLNERVRSQQGRFSRANILAAMKGEEATDRMLRLMEEWEIIFRERSDEQVWIAPQYLPDEHPMENLFTIALAGLQENFYLFRAPLFYIRRILRHLVLRFGRDEEVEAKEYWKYGILFVVRPPEGEASVQAERLRVFIKSLPDERDSALGRLMVCIEPGKKRTEPWRELIFREVLHTFIETRSYWVSAGISSGIPLREVAKQRGELALSINGQDFASIQRIVLDAEAGFSAVVSEERRRIPMPEYAPLLRAVEITPPAPSLFISYSHADTEYRKTLETHLGALRRLGRLISWSDGQLIPGQDWNEAILRNLRSADIVLLLISPDSLDSDYIWKVELAEAMKRQEQGKCRVIPVLLRPCDWKDMAFSRLEVSPKDPRNARPKPVSLWLDKDEAFTVVVQGIKKALKELAVI